MIAKLLQSDGLPDRVMPADFCEKDSDLRLVRVYNIVMTEPSSPSENTVIPHDDYIEIIWDGAQNADKVRRSNAQILAAAETLQANQKPLLLSLFIQNHPLAPNMAAFNEALKMFRAVSFERLAISGTLPPTIMTLVTTVIASFDKELEIAYFNTKPEALSWLVGAKV